MCSRHAPWKFHMGIIKIIFVIFCMCVCVWKRLLASCLVAGWLVNSDYSIWRLVSLFKSWHFYCISSFLWNKECLIRLSLARCWCHSVLVFRSELKNLLCCEAIRFYIYHFHGRSEIYLFLFRNVDVKSLLISTEFLKRKLKFETNNERIPISCPNLKKKTNISIVS